MDVKMPEIERMYFEITNSCNFNCEFCASMVSKRKKQVMDFEIFKKGVDEIAQQKLSKIVCYHIAGEPLLCPRIAEAVAYTKSKGLKTEITTNGALLTRENVEKLIEAGLDEFYLSMPLNETEALMRSSSLNFNDYYKNVIAMAKLVDQSHSPTKMRLRIMNYYTQKLFGVENEKSMSQLKKEFKARLEKFVGDLVGSLGVQIPAQKLKDVLEKINSLNPEVLWITNNVCIETRLFIDWKRIFDSTKKPVKIGFCGAAFTNVGVLSNGEVVICCADYEGVTSLGNLVSQSLTSLLHSQKAQEIVKGFQRYRVTNHFCQLCLGGQNFVESYLKGLVSIYLFKIQAAHKTKEIYLFDCSSKAS